MVNNGKIGLWLLLVKHGRITLQLLRDWVVHLLLDRRWQGGGLLEQFLLQGRRFLG